MPRRPKPTQEAIDAVLAAAASGTPCAEIARISGLADDTVRRWVEKYGDPNKIYFRTNFDQSVKDRLNPPRPDPEPAAEHDPGPDVPPGADALTTVRAAIVRLQALEREARAAGNFSAAQRALRDIGAAVTVAARLEKEAHGSTFALRLTEHELAEARARLDERVKALTAAPLLCENCGRELRVRWAKH